jgi:hypothetical protein
MTQYCYYGPTVDVIITAGTGTELDCHGSQYVYTLTYQPSGYYTTTIPFDQQPNYCYYYEATLIPPDAINVGNPGENQGSFSLSNGEAGVVFTATNGNRCSPFPTWTSPLGATARTGASNPYDCGGPGTYIDEGPPSLACLDCYTPISPSDIGCSIVGNTHAFITLVNNSDCYIDMVWINYPPPYGGCCEEFYNTVAPGHFFAQDSWITHPWRFYINDNGALIYQQPGLGGRGRFRPAVPVPWLSTTAAIRCRSFQGTAMAPSSLRQLPTR